MIFSSYHKVDSIIQATAKGRSFVDIGPCWQTKFEKISVAHKAGASNLTAVDIVEENSTEWQSFEQKLKNIQFQKFPATDVMNFDQTHDVVYCSGVIYHIVDHFSFVRKLSSLTNQHLLLKTLVAPPDFGIIDGSCVFLPALNEKDRQRFVDDLKSFVGNYNIPGLTFKPEQVSGRGWWWMFTPLYIQCLLESVGFEIQEKFRLSKHDVFFHAKCG